MNQDSMLVASFHEFYARFQDYGQKQAFILPNGTISYQRFSEDIGRLSRILPNGGKNILLNTLNKYYFAVGFFAAELRGNTVCLQPSATGISDYYQDFEFSCLITDEFVKKALTGPYTELQYNPSAEIAVILFSSGTTVSPKAVALNESNIMSDLSAGIARFGYTSEDRILSIIPYTHIFGLICDLCAPLFCGSSFAFAYDLSEFLSLLPSFNPTTLHLTPGIVELLLKMLESGNKRDSVVGDKLQRIMSGGADTTSELCLAMKRFGIDVYGCYGLTECSCGVSLCSKSSNRIGSAGLPLDCNTVSIDEDGLISVEGRNVMLGYMDRSCVLHPLAERIFKTGDIGYLDEEGFLYVTGRVDDLIVFSDGKKLMPQTVEHALCRHSCIIEAMVYPDAKDRVTAVVYISKNAQEEEVKCFAHSLNFDGHGIATVETTREPLPKTHTGKLKRSHNG